MWTSRWRRAALWSAALAMLAAGACAAPEPAPPDEGLTDPPSSGGADLDVSGAELWLSFDDAQVGFDGSPEYADAQEGPFAGRVLTANGGTARPVAGAPGRGRALAFPERCTDDSGCPRALVEVPADPALEPGAAPFAYGASVLLERDQTAIGSNIVQSGRFGSAGGQWKLQVDGADGRPSCVIRSGDEVLSVRSETGVADGDWHRIVCRRDGRGISIDVDGSVERRAGPSGPLETGLPVRIGSPGTGDHDDQFHGIVDDVVVDIDPED
ncbi:LamG-like jellyroll fold domain-containing protein [Nocardioides sp. SYSU D00065]|uniref:LamG-like jellyroll fold domain-containing protein n=1 Tax=Nocardioides sp. SYSU D00065 TaxID=2817378 RepID=UPI001B32EF3E|nr:LamG-like jellyroll fold domain-containing protein [Nocardioides sp. SYSU D00065]